MEAKPLDGATGRGGRGLWPGSKREAVAIEQRRTQVADFYCQAYSQAEIGRRLGVNRSTITRDLKRVRAEWRRQRGEYFDEKVEAMMARIDLLERTYWEEYERSKKEKTTEHAERSQIAGGHRTRAGQRTEERLGDPAYLAGIQWCIDRRCRILGVEAAPKVPVDETGKAVAGVLVVPTPVSAEEWSGTAQAQQRALLKEHVQHQDRARLLRAPGKIV